MFFSWVTHFSPSRAIVESARNIGNPSTQAYDAKHQRAAFVLTSNFIFGRIAMIFRIMPTSVAEDEGRPIQGNQRVPLPRICTNRWTFGRLRVQHRQRVLPVLQRQFHRLTLAV